MAKKNTEQEEKTETPVKEKKKSTSRSRKSTKESKLQEALEEKEQELSELKDKYLRLFAEFDNFRKRTIQEKLDMMKNAAQDTMSALLPVLDDFDRAKISAEDENSKEVFSEGVQLVYQKLHSTLENKGLKVMESTGLEFDPELHEAITKIPSPTKDMKGKNIDTIEKGYYLKDKIIRHAKVVIGE